MSGRDTCDADCAASDDCSARVPLAPVFLPPLASIGPECESSGCDCDDEFDIYVPEAPSACCDGLCTIDPDEWGDAEKPNERTQAAAQRARDLLTSDGGS